MFACMWVAVVLFEHVLEDEHVCMYVGCCLGPMHTHIHCTCNDKFQTHIYHN